MSTASQHNSVIYDRFWSRCRTLGFGPASDGRPVPTYCRSVPGEWEPVVADLVEAFGEEHLEASGVAKRGEDGQWTLAPSLTPGRAILVALREAKDEPPFEILTPSGGLAGSEIPVTAVLRDRRIKDWLPLTRHRLFVCPSTGQIPPLWALALPATTLSGLLDLNAKQLRAVCRQLGWKMLGPQASKEAAEDLVRLVLVNWYPQAAEAEEKHRIREAAAFLAMAERCLGIDMSHCAVWSPDESELDRFRFCLKLGDLGAAREALLESVDRSSYMVSAYADPGFVPRRKPWNLVEASADLERCINEVKGDAPSDQRRRQAEELFEGFVDAELIKPLLGQSLDSSDPLQRNLGLVAAETCRLLHRQGPYLGRDILSLAKGSFPSEEQKRVLEQVRHRERQVTNLIRLAEVLRK